MASASDDFARAPGGLGSNWNVNGGFQITGGEDVGNSNYAADAEAAWKAAVTNFSDDHYSEVQLITGIDTTVVGTGVGVVLRNDEPSSGHGNTYRIVGNSSTPPNIEIAKFVGGSYSLISVKSLALADGDFIAGQVQGTSLSAWVNGVQSTLSTDSSITTGQPGIAYSSTCGTPILDNWQAVDLGGAVAPARPPAVYADPFQAVGQPGSGFFHGYHDPTPRVTSQTFQQALDATPVAITATLQKQVNKNVTSTTTITATLNKLVSKTLSSTSSILATLTKRTNKTLSSTTTITATLQRQINKLLTSTVSITATLQKQINKLLTSTTTITATLQKQVNKILSSTVTITATLLAQKVILVLLTSTVNITASLQKQVNKVLTSNVSITPTLAKTVLKNLTSTTTITATLLAQKVIVLLLTSTVNITASLTKQVNKALNTTVTITPTLTKRVSKTLSSTTTITATLVTQFIAGGAAVARKLRMMMGMGK